MGHGSPDGAVKLTAGDDGACALLRAWNDGLPMAPSDIPELFTPLWRSGNSACEARIGLGLDICSEIVKAHAAQLCVAPSATAGTGSPCGCPSVQWRGRLQRTA